MDIDEQVYHATRKRTASLSWLNETLGAGTPSAEGQIPLTAEEQSQIEAMIQTMKNLYVGGSQ